MLDGLPVACEEEELRFRMGELGVQRRRVGMVAPEQPAQPCVFMASFTSAFKILSIPL